MKTTITILALVFATSINAQTKATSQPKTTPQKAAETKTITAYYKYGVTAGGAWSGLIFTDDTSAEIRFLNKNNEGKEIAEFWNPEVTGEDPDDVSSELHTISSNVGKKYKLTYTVKKVKNKGYDTDGASYSNENVIVGFELIPSDKLLMADGDYGFANDEISLSFSITNSGKTISARVINMIKNGMLNGKGDFVNINNVTGYQFQTGSCLFEFDLPTDKLILRQSGCKYGEPTKEFILTKNNVIMPDKNMAIDYKKWKLELAKYESQNPVSNNPASIAQKFIISLKKGNVQELKLLSENIELNKKRGSHRVSKLIEALEKSPEKVKKEMAHIFEDKFNPFILYYNPEAASVAVARIGNDNFYYISVLKINGQWKVVEIDDQPGIDGLEINTYGYSPNIFVENFVNKRIKEVNP